MLLCTGDCNSINVTLKRFCLWQLEESLFDTKQCIVHGVVTRVVSRLICIGTFTSAAVLLLIGGHFVSGCETKFR